MQWARIRPQRSVSRNQATRTPALSALLVRSDLMPVFIFDADAQSEEESPPSVVSRMTDNHHTGSPRPARCLSIGATRTFLIGTGLNSSTAKYQPNLTAATCANRAVIGRQAERVLERCGGRKSVQDFFFASRK